MPIIGLYTASHAWDHIPGPLDSHEVTDAQIEFRHVGKVVECGIGDRHAAYADGVQACDWRDDTGSADLKVDGLKGRRDLWGWVLVGNGPPRGTGEEAELLL